MTHIDLDSTALVATIRAGFADEVARKVEALRDPCKSNRHDPERFCQCGYCDDGCRYCDITALVINDVIKILETYR